MTVFLVALSLILLSSLVSTALALRASVRGKEWAAEYAKIHGFREMATVLSLCDEHEGRQMVLAMCKVDGHQHGPIDVPSLRKVRVGRGTTSISIRHGVKQYETLVTKGGKRPPNPPVDPTTVGTIPSPPPTVAHSDGDQRISGIETQPAHDGVPCSQAHPGTPHTRHIPRPR